MQWINGNFTQSVKQSYTYILQATKEGNYIIGSASINLGNTTYKTKPITITVTKSQQTASSPPSGSNNIPKQQNTINENNSSDDLFVRTYVSKNKVYKGEQITLTHKLYTALPRVDLIDIKPPAYSNFWTEQIDANKTITPQNEIVNGKTYKVAEISKTVLFPQKDGIIRIEPIQVECNVQILKQRNANSWVEEMFYGPRISYYDSEKRKIKSNPITITVEDLPLQGKPANFNGAVGNFTISAEISKTHIKANEAIDLNITISGTGNLKLIDNLPITFPPDFETYDPKITDAINITASGVTGKRTFNYVIIPLHEGNYQLQPISFSFFDPKKGSYITLSTQNFNITVEKADGKSLQQLVTTYQKDIKYIHSDIRYIKTKPFTINKKNNIFWGSNLYFASLLIPPILFTLFIIAYRKQMQLKSDVAYIRNRKARKTAQLKLKKAKHYMDNKQFNDFFVEISQALWGYTADKFNIPLAELSLEKIKEIMSNKNIPEDKQTILINLLEECEFARFAPGDNTEKMNKLYTGAIEVITSFES